MIPVPVIIAAIQAIPGILAQIKLAHAQANPNAAPLTDEQVFTALKALLSSSLATDVAWLAAHPG